MMRWIREWCESPCPHVAHDPAKDGEDEDTSDDGEGDLPTEWYFVAKDLKHERSLPAEGIDDSWQLKKDATEFF